MSDDSQHGDLHSMRELRIVLLGKNEEENKRVKKLISGSVRPIDEHKNGYIRVINFPVLQPSLSLYQIIQTVRGCVAVSHPGPHVFILVLQHNDFSEEDSFRVKMVLKEFSEQAIKRTIVLTTDKESYTSMFKSVIKNVTKELIKECGERHIQFCSETEELRSWIFQRVEKILIENDEEYLTCKISEEEEQSDDEEASNSEVSVKVEEQGEFDQKQADKHKKKQKMKRFFQLKPIRGKKPKLNVVLCGGDRTLHMSNLIQGKKTIPSHDMNKSKVCARRELEVCGRLINLIELPALTRLSEDEVMNETSNCVSLCDPGVHVFLLIVVPSEPLTEEVKAEIEKIEMWFQSKKNFMVIFTVDVTVKSVVKDFVESNADCQRLISLCGGRYKLLGLMEHEKSNQIPDLLDYIEKMKSEPYSLNMYMRAQKERVRHETKEKYEKELKKMGKKIQDLQKMQPEGAQCEAEDLKCLRIVLIGKTGSGKSASGNTILGRNQFQSKLGTNSVTTVCEKGVLQVDGQSVAVVDTPGLFDTTLSNDQVIEEIMKCVSLSSPGPHAFIIVLTLGRFTKEETDTIDLMKKIFGPKVAQFSIILFTRGDDLKDQSIEDFVRESKSADLNKLIRDCGDRYLAFNNNETQDRTQVMKLIKMIEEMKTTNHSRYFTNSMFEEAEMSIKKRMDEILKEKEREIQAQKDEIKAKHEIEMKNMMKRLEEEKRKADEERVQMENKFKEQEETLRKEFDEKEKTEQQKREKEKQKQLEEEKQQRTEYDQMIEKMKEEIEQQRSQYEKKEKERKEEDRKKEEKYKQDQEKMKAKEDLIIQLQKKQEDEIKKRDLDEQKRREQEETERKEWVRKIREAENDRKETREEIKRQQREWEEDKKRQMREREEEEIKRRERHEEQLREKQELENMRKKLEKEKQERQQREEERQKLRQEREEKEREYEVKKNYMMKHYKKLEQERKEEWERKRREDDERREEERKRWEKRIEDIKREKEEAIKRIERERKDKEEKVREEMQQEHEQRIKEMMKKHEDEARKQAEEFNEFREKNEQQIKELKEKFEEYQEIHKALEKILLLLSTIKSEEVKQLKKEIEELQKKKKSKCVIM